MRALLGNGISSNFNQFIEGVFIHMRISKWLMLLAVVAIVIGLSACGGNKTNQDDAGMNNDGQGAGNGGTETDANTGGANVDAAAAEAIYKKNCIGCHAVDLAGGVGPNLQKVGAKISVDEIKAKIANGAGGMPAYKDQLSEVEIDALSNWLAAMK